MELGKLFKNLTVSLGAAIVALFLKFPTYFHIFKIYIKQKKNVSEQISTIEKEVSKHEEVIIRRVK